jgi:hypothetical protein
MVIMTVMVSKIS